MPVTWPATPIRRSEPALWASGACTALELLASMLPQFMLTLDGVETGKRELTP